MQTKLYRNDSDQVYTIPGLGIVGPGQRISHTGDFPPAINLINYPGLIDVVAEEEAGTTKDYEAEPEPYFEEPTTEVNQNA